MDIKIVNRDGKAIAVDQDSGTEVEIDPAQLKALQSMLENEDDNRIDGYQNYRNTNTDAHAEMMDGGGILSMSKEQARKQGRLADEPPGSIVQSKGGVNVSMRPAEILSRKEQPKVDVTIGEPEILSREMKPLKDDPSDSYGVDDMYAEHPELMEKYPNLARMLGKK